MSRAAAPEGQCPVEYRGYFVRPSVRHLIVSADLGTLALVALALGLRLCHGDPAHKVETMAQKRYSVGGPIFSDFLVFIN